MRGLWAAVLAAILSSAAGLGCAETKKLTFAWPPSLVTVIPYIALDKGYFAAEGLDVEAKMFPSGPTSLVALLSGHAHIQNSAEGAMIHAIIQGNEIVNIASVAESREPKLVARKDHGIAAPRDFIGKRVATSAGSQSDYFMYKFFKENGIPLDQVKITNMSGPDMIVALVNGDIDAYFCGQPYVYYGMRQLAEKAIVFYPAKSYRDWSPVNMSAEFVRKNPETVRKVIRAFLKAEEFVDRQPKEAQRLVARRLGMEEKALAVLWKDYDFKVTLDRRLLEQMQNIGRWALEIAKSDKPLPDFRKYIYEDALAKERPSAVRL